MLSGQCGYPTIAFTQFFFRLIRIWLLRSFGIPCTHLLHLFISIAMMWWWRWFMVMPTKSEHQFVGRMKKPSKKRMKTFAWETTKNGLESNRIEKKLKFPVVTLRLPSVFLFELIRFYNLTTDKYEQIRWLNALTLPPLILSACHPWSEKCKSYFLNWTWNETISRIKNEMKKSLENMRNMQPN